MQDPRTVTRLLWMAMCAAPLAFVVTCVIAAPGGRDTTPWLPFGLGLAALFDGYLSVHLPRGYMRASFRSSSLETRIEASGEEASSRKGAPPGKVIVEPRKEVLRRVWPVYQTPFILGMAMSMSIVVFGLVLAMTGYDALVYAPFFAAGWIMMLLRYPSEERLARAIERELGARFRSEG